MDVSEGDCEVVRKVCGAVSTRAARLAATGVVALVSKIEKIGSCTVAVDGSLYKKHPLFKDRSVIATSHCALAVKYCIFINSGIILCFYYLFSLFFNLSLSLFLLQSPLPHSFAPPCILFPFLPFSHPFTQTLTHSWITLSSPILLLLLLLYIYLPSLPPFLSSSSLYNIPPLSPPPLFLTSSSIFHSSLSLPLLSLSLFSG